MHKKPRRRWHTGSRIQDDPTPDSPEYDLWLQNTETSPFLRLPPEICNRIYALVLTVGQIHIRYRPWYHHKRIQKGKHYTETIRGGYYAVVLDASQDPWDSGSQNPLSAYEKAPQLPMDFFHVGGGLGLRKDLTLLSPACRQLYRDTALLPFCLNAWSFENTRIMERYLLREKSLLLLQRRAICNLIVDEWPPRSVESHLGGLRVIIWKKGKKLQQWELDGAGGYRKISVGGFKRYCSRPVICDLTWHLYT